MIAIWPLGPPKLMNPSFSQKRNASRKLGWDAGIARTFTQTLFFANQKTRDRLVRAPEQLEFADSSFTIRPLPGMECLV